MKKLELFHMNIYYGMDYLIQERILNYLEFKKLKEWKKK